ncbi:hypothetical protein [Actinosynnema pretiosum]|nr:hypothetical protein [Actinosynnema pretiosum]
MRTRHAYAAEVTERARQAEETREQEACTRARPGTRCGTGCPHCWPAR